MQLMLQSTVLISAATFLIVCDDFSKK